MANHCKKLIPNEILQHYKITHDKKGRVESEGLFMFIKKLKFFELISIPVGMNVIRLQFCNLMWNC